MADLVALHSALLSVNDWPVTTSAVAVVDANGLVASHGDLDQLFALASVTKVVTALSMLVAVEEGTVAWNDLVRPGITLAHLLSHSGGVSRDEPTSVSAPETRRLYSNAGFELAAAHLASRSHIAFGEYVAEAVLDPLEMSLTSLHGRAATDAESTVGDLGRLAHQLLAPTLVSVATLAEATRPWLPQLAGVLPGFGHQDPNPWGLGFEIRGHKAPHWTGSLNSPATFGHFGQAGGFLWVDPQRMVALCSLSDRDFGPWATHAWPALADAVLATW